MTSDFAETKERVQALLYYDTCMNYLTDLVPTDLEQLVSSILGPDGNNSYPNLINDESVIKCLNFVFTLLYPILFFSAALSLRCPPKWGKAAPVRTNREQNRRPCCRLWRFARQFDGPQRSVSQIQATRGSHLSFLGWFAQNCFFFFDPAISCFF